MPTSNYRWHGGRRPTSSVAVSGAPGSYANVGTQPPGSGDSEFNEPPGFEHVWTENFDAPTQQITSPTIKRKFYTRFYQDGNDAEEFDHIWQLDGINDEDGGEGLIGSTDNKVAAIEIPDGWSPFGGSGDPVTMISHGWGTNTEIYLRYRIKLSNDYKHWLGGKFGYIACGTGTNGRVCFIALNPVGAYTNQIAAETRPIKFSIGFQGVVPPTSGPDAGQSTWNADPNLIPASQNRIVRGTWNILEIHGIQNTPTLPDGEFHMWLNGVKFTEFTNVGWFRGTAGQANTFSQFNWTPTHDDFNGEPWIGNAAQYLDYLYVSRKV